MKLAPLEAAIVHRLEAAGYQRVPTPFTIASVRFDFTAALRGEQPRPSDFVLILDTSVGEFSDQNKQRARHRVEALRGGPPRFHAGSKQVET